MRRARARRDRGDRAAGRLPDARLAARPERTLRSSAPTIVDVPAEAARGERPSGAAWEPTFLISARVDLDADGGLGGAGDRVAATFERVVTTLRLYKSGGVGLGPHGWVRIAGDRWRRIATGAARPRPGGYRLSEEDLRELADLARSVSRPSASDRPGCAARCSASRQASIAAAPSTLSTTICWRSASCSRARAPPGSACRCGRPR